MILMWAFCNTCSDFHIEKTAIRVFLHGFSNSSLQLCESIQKIIYKLICRGMLQVYFESIKNLAMRYTSSIYTLNLFFKYTYKWEVKQLPNAKITRCPQHFLIQKYSWSRLSKFMYLFSDPKLYLNCNFKIHYLCSNSEVHLK